MFKFNIKEAESLFNKYLSLNTNRKEIIDIYTALYHGTDSLYVRKIKYNKTKSTRLNIEKELPYLEEIGLLTKIDEDYAISRAPRELILDYISTQQDFESLSRVVFNFFKGNYVGYISAIRNFRLALHGDDVGDIRYWYNKSLERMYSSDWHFAISIFNSPFSESRLKLLPLEYQDDVLSYILNYQLTNGLEDNGALLYYIKNNNSIGSLTDDFDALILGGINKTIGNIFMDKNNRNELIAIENIRNGLNENPEIFNNITYWADSSIIFQLIAEINTGDREKIKLFTETLLDLKGTEAIEGSLEAIYSYCKIFLGEENAIDIDDFILNPLESKTLYGVWIKLLVLNWIDDPSFKKTLGRVLKTIEDIPISKFFVKEFQDLSENKGVVTLIKPIERWESVLTSLTNLFSKEKDTTEKDQRLAWRLSILSSVIWFAPIIQKKSKNGKWSQGRKIEFYDIPYQYDTLNHTETDKKMVQVGSNFNSYGHYYYESDHSHYEQMAKLAIGHKHLYDEKSRNNIILEEVPLVLESKKVKESIELKVSPSGLSKGLMSIKKRDNVWSITFLSEEQRSIINVIGGKLKIPSNQLFKLTEFFTAIESKISVKGEVKILGEGLDLFQGITIPQIFITPLGNGLEFKIRVVPSKDSQSFIPGTGKTEYIGADKDVSVVVVRDLELENSVSKDFINSIPPFKDQFNQEFIWEFPDNLEALEVLEQLNEHELKPILNWPQGEKINILKTVTSSSLFSSVNHNNEWFEVSGETEIDSNRVLTLKQLMALSDLSSSRFIQLDTGEYIALTKSLKHEIDTLNTYSQKSKGDVIKLHPLAMFAMQDSHMGKEFSESKKWIKQFKKNHEKNFDIPNSIKAELRDYQEDGYLWIMRLAESGAGALLADDMGLGKTLQAIVMLTAKKSNKPSIIVVPASLIYNWDSEIRNFSPSLNPSILGIADREKHIENLKGGDVLIVSYGIVQRNSQLFQSRKWSTMVLDEAQAVKNSATKRTKAISSIPRDFTLITTGTPIENHLGELWSLFNIILPGFLGSATSFKEKYQEPIEKSENKEVRKRLKRLISPFILRRTKEEVLTELPPKTEVDLVVEMSKDEKVLYEALRQRAVENIENSTDEGDHRFRVLAEITKLRQASCHPMLIDKKSTIKSSKLSLFTEKVAEIIGTKHQALVFSQFVGHLKIIAANLDELGIPYFYLDGSTPAKKRGVLVEQFQNSERPIFLISLKAGGSGLNLTAADYVFHMDPWWNPAVEDQASDRVHRIGQERPVTIYRLITGGTIEEKIISMHKNKRNLAESLLNDGGSALKIDTKDLITIISGK